MTLQQEEYIKAFCSHLNRCKRKESKSIAGIALSDRLMLFSRLGFPRDIDLQKIEATIPKVKQELNAMFEGDLLFIWKDENSRWDAFDDASQIFGYIHSGKQAN